MGKLGEKIFMVSSVLMLVLVYLLQVGITEEQKPSKENTFREPEHQYVGVKKCKICHNSKKLGGEEYKVWVESKHAKAYETLGTEEAKKVAKEKGVDNPQEDGKCLKCHTLAYGVDKKWVGEDVTKEEGVSCEVCHGPGADYKDKETMKDKQKAIEKGLVIPDEKTCISCHNQESPTFKEFKYDEFKEKIKHWEKE